MFPFFLRRNFCECWLEDEIQSNKGNSNTRQIWILSKFGCKWRRCCKEKFEIQNKIRIEINVCVKQGSSIRRKRMARSMSRWFLSCYLCINLPNRILHLPLKPRKLSRNIWPRLINLRNWQSRLPAISHLLLVSMKLNWTEHHQSHKKVSVMAPSLGLKRAKRRLQQNGKRKKTRCVAEEVAASDENDNCLPLSPIVSCRLA